MPRAAATSTLPTTTAPLTSTSAPPASTIGSQATAFAKAAKSAVNSAGAEGAEKAKINAQAAAKVSARLRWNNVLNQVTRRGSFTGNSAGVLGKQFELLTSSI